MVQACNASDSDGILAIVNNALDSGSVSRWINNKVYKLDIKNAKQLIPEWTTCLNVACLYSTAEVVKLLIEKCSAVPRCGDSLKNCPLHNACASGVDR